METNNFEKQIIDRLNHHLPNADYTQLWDNLEARLAKRKKRRLLIWLFLGIGFLFSYFIFRYAGAYETAAIPIADKTDKQEIKSTTENLIDNEIYKFKNNRKLFPKKNSDTNLSSEYNFEMLPESEINHSMPMPSTTNLKNISGLSSNFIVSQINNKDYSANSLSAVKNKINELPDIKTDTNLLDIESQDDVANDQLLFQRSLPLKIESIIFHQPQVIDLPYIASKSKTSTYKNNKWDISFAAMTNLASLSFSESTAQNDANDKALLPNLGYSISVYASYLFNNAWSLVGGFQFSNLVDKFTYNNTLVTEKEFFNPRAFNLEGNFIGANQYFSKTTMYDILHYNSQKTGSVYAGLTYHIGKKWQSSFLLNYILFQSYKGRLLDADLAVVKSGPYFQESAIRKVFPTIRLGYEIDAFHSTDLMLFIGYSNLKYYNHLSSPLQNAIRHNIEIGVSIEH